LTIKPTGEVTGDLLGRDKFGESLYRIIKEVDHSFVVCIDSAWGTGKTTFARRWMEILLEKDPPIRTVYFNAFESDYSDDPFVSFVSEVKAFADEINLDNDPAQALATQFAEKALPVGKALLALSFKILLHKLTLGMVTDGDIGKVLDKASDDWVDTRIKEFHSEKQSFLEFKKSLESLAKSVKTAQTFPLTIIVDELDRCKPDYALKVIERVKHLFEVPNVCFIFLVHLKQIEDYVSVVYGSQGGSENYLHKFFDFYTTLPTSRSVQTRDSHYQYLGYLEKKLGLTQYQDFFRFILPFVRIYDLSLRDMEKFASHLLLYVSSLPTRPQAIELHGLLILTKVKFPELIRAVLRSRVTLSDFLLKTGLDNTDEKLEPTQVRYLTLIKWGLVSQDQFSSLFSALEASDRKWYDTVLGTESSSSRYEAFRSRTEEIAYFLD